MKTTDRTIVITGASSGVGRAISLAFAQKHNKLIIASRNITALEELALECRQLGSQVLCVETDTSEISSVINLAAMADDFGAGIDVWVNNAGVLAIGEFDVTPMELNEQVIKTNLLGYMNGAHAVLPFFKKQKSGIIINNISIGGFLPVPFGTAYSASKFGLRGFSAALKAELTDYKNIHVCDTFPAFLDTPGIQHAANYTGKQLKPAPPVYDPNRVAAAIVSISEYPKSETMVGSASILLRASYGLFPGLTRGIAGMVIRQYLKHADPIEKTDGNIYNPLKFGNAVHGGWGLPGKPKAHRKYLAAGIVLAVGLLVLSKRS
ncbi:SDR family oxidoreductase [Pedobacter duraquae]|uniref:Short-subunit dehydrogenase n=1 Tax=Pedobacter duraquae TaxID=425511 RepID=A0A4R6ILU9_9SPHI|nr:SDR family oxidoreductase [Pedobacter duraquae]TDO22946.1 short-subunit dehydrogenase [Pedobacter duraquae]